MEAIFLVILILLLGVVSAILYLNLRSKPEDQKENKEAEEIANLKSEISSLKDTLNTTINSSLGAMSTSFNNLSTGVTKDMASVISFVTPVDRLLNEVAVSYTHLTLPTKQAV